MTALLPLPENIGLAFHGEPVWPPALITNQLAEQLATARNPCGRPNSDVLRRRLTLTPRGISETWQIDFPGHFTPQEAALYEQPFALIQQRTGDSTWVNLWANANLRRALARTTRYLAMPINSAEPDWQWVEDDLLPDASLLVVARDDDFTHGILQSSVFALWHTEHRTRLAPELIVGSFPFPWPPATALSALTAAQEDQRHGIARAARSGNVEQLNIAVITAYGWAEEIDDGEVLVKLKELNRARSG